MEKFLKDYVKMYVEANGIELNNAQIKEIVQNIEANDEFWNILDDLISEEIEEIEEA